MNRFEKILVCVSHPEADAKRLQYVSALTRLAASTELHMLCVIQSNDGGGMARSKGSGMTLQTLHQLVEGNLEKGTSRNDFCVFLEGSPISEILRYAREKDVDLIVTGEETDMACQIAQKSTCSVLTLPKEATITASKILVPVRDSECSANALETACLAAQATGGEVVALNVYRVPGERTIGGPSETQVNEGGRLAEEEVQRLLKRTSTQGIPIRVECVPKGQKGTGPTILAFIAQEKADLVVIGARGRTEAAGMLLGQITVNLIRRSPVPLLAVKKKGEVFGVLDALRTLVGQR